MHHLQYQLNIKSYQFLQNNSQNQFLWYLGPFFHDFRVSFVGRNLCSQGDGNHSISAYFLILLLETWLIVCGILQQFASYRANIFNFPAASDTSEIFFTKLVNECRRKNSKFTKDSPVSSEIQIISCVEFSEA